MADALPVGADGFVDMDALPDVDPDLALEPDAMLSLHDALHAAPVPEPDAATWAGIVDAAVSDTSDLEGLDDLVPEQGDAGPFALDDDLLDDDLDDDLDLDADLGILDDADGADAGDGAGDDLDDDADLVPVAVDATGDDGLAPFLADDAGFDDAGFDAAGFDDAAFDVGDDELEGPTHVDGLDDGGAS